MVYFFLVFVSIIDSREESTSRSRKSFLVFNSAIEENGEKRCF